MEKKQIVFLYSELATYFLACVEELLKQPSVQVHIVRWSVNKEAPFDFSFAGDLKIYEREEYRNDADLQRLINSIQPSVIYCSGWLDKGYMKVCKHYRKKIPVVVGFDNQWKGTLKQRIAALISPFTILNHYSHCWVPGSLQHEYALRLGFKKENILTGFYSCDFNLFHKHYLANRQNKTQRIPHRFIYMGRYYAFKGVSDLWQAFIDLDREYPNDWELWCLGTGDIKPVEHPRIRHFGFVQPSDLTGFLKDTGVFILPSHFEPWGVVVHEFAAAGFPIVCSDEVGARVAFVENNFNGYIYKSGDVKALKEMLCKIINDQQDHLAEMADRSAEKAALITPETWTKQLMTLLR